MGRSRSRTCVEVMDGVTGVIGVIGVIGVESAVGAGSTCWVESPCATTDAGPVAEWSG